jgi:peptide/nickel transport system substrate-binding protein
MKTGKLLSLFFALTLTLAAAATGRATGVAERLIVLTGSDASTFDPHFCTDSATELFNKNMYNNLVRFNGDMKLEPDLAESWEVSEDGLDWTFHLRKSVKFHDGTDFTAKDVKATFDRLLDPDVGAPVKRSVLISGKEIEVVDDYTVVIHTNYPTGSMLMQLASPGAAIISSAAIEKYGRDLGTHPVGAGAFKLSEWKTGEEIILERYEGYYGGAPMIQKVHFRIVPEDATRSMLLEANQADIALWLPVTEVKRLAENKNIRTFEQNTLMTQYVALNNSKPALSDVRVRRALNHAVDKNVIVRDIVEGQGNVADAPISPYTWGYSSIKTYEYDVEKAKQLLAEAGYADGLELELWSPVGRYLMDIQIAENLQAQWAKVGVNVKIRQWEVQSMLEEVKKGQYDMVYLGWSPSNGDADNGLYGVFHSSMWVPNANRAKYSNSEVDKLLDAGRRETDLTTRAEVYKQAETIIMEECPWVFLFWPKQMMMYRSGVDGLVLLPTEHLLLEKATKR